MSEVTGGLMLLAAIVGFMGTVVYGYTIVSGLTQIGALVLIVIAVVVALVAEFSVAGASILIDEVLRG